MPKYPLAMRKIGKMLPIVGGLIEERNRLARDLVATQLELQKRPKPQNSKLAVKLPISEEDLLSVNTKTLKSLEPYKRIKNKKKLVVNWVIPPLLSHEGGGHTTILSIIRYLEKQGYECRIYNYDPLKITNLENIKKVCDMVFPDLTDKHFYGTSKMMDCDVIFATSWETAYPVFNYQNNAKKMYLVQDYEPYFFPVGSHSNLAMQTYNFGFHGVTAGGWLQKKLAEDHKMKSDAFDFSADKNLYNLKNPNKRKKVLFYFQPFKSRRGFELGIYALKTFNKMHPEYEILLLGTDEVNFKIPFKYKNLGAVHRSKLNDIYNECAAALIIGFTNMSLLPLEVMASGCIPIVNEGENNRLVSNNPNIVYAPPFPEDLAMALSSVVGDKNLLKRAKSASKSVNETSWTDSYEKISQIIQDQVYEK